ncbi:hypothetical protein N0V88_006502 [Collariella sp. IMI 366227]|nr:hypothetical protein N0V88_006502 [Collariella sp. IMI 366227]
MASFGSHAGVSVTKITKGRKTAMKPILKKLSHSEKNSLDLDRGWDEQQEVRAWEGGYGYYAGQVKDVTFGVGDVGSGSGGGGGVPVPGGGSSFRSKLQHGRSGSQTSAGSVPRGPFVHPFAQTPRTSTPPLSYANSLASFDNNGRDHSPTITENEDDDGFDTTTTYAPSHALSQPSHSPPSLSQGNLRRPSLNSQRTASFPTETPGSKPPSLRISTAARSVSGTTASSSRFLHGSLPAGSSSDLHITSSHTFTVPGSLDSPTGSLINSGGVSLSQQQQSSQISPLRTSLDMAGFPRLRAKSELDTATRNENIRAARRKFEERERAKEEKYDREMIRKRERRDNKEASRIEKGEAPGRPSFHRKRTPTGLSVLSTSSAVGVTSGAQPVNDDAITHRAPSNSFGSASAPPGSTNIGLGISRRKNTNSPAPMTTDQEKLAFASHKYDSVPLQTPPNIGRSVRDVQFESTQQRRGSSAKHKTQSYWQGFILWLRTKLLRLSSR